MSVGPHTTKPGPRRKWGGTTIHAEDGLVVIQDNEDGNISVMSVAEAERFIKDRGAELEVHDRNRSNDGNPTKRAYSIEYYHCLRSWIEAMNETVRDAKEQGDQNDPEVRKKKLLAFLREKRAGQTETRQTAESLIYQGIQGPMIFGPHSQLPNFKPSKPMVFATPAVPAAWLTKG